MWELPVGFVRTEEDLVEKIADRQVQEAIASVFRKFREFGSARQTTLWYHDQRIPLPHVRPGTGSSDIIWQLPTAHRLYQIVKNPIYAGALAYGKTAAKTVVEDQRARTASTRRRKPPEEWTILIRDNHAGYISWDEYLANQRILEANVARRGGTTPGAAKRGPALLAGLLRCGRCGRKLFVAYSGRGGRVPRYACAGSRTGQDPTTCLSLGGVTIEQAVTDQVLEALQPVGIEASLTAVDQLDHTHTEQRRALELALEKARYQAQRAERQYHTVDPDNRLVAGELEVRWNDALVRVGQLEADLAALADTQTVLTPEQRQHVLELGNDLPAVWHHPHASPDLKKRILRTVLHEIVIDTDETHREHVLHLHWQGGVHTQLRVPCNRRGHRRVRTERTAIDLIRELSKVCRDAAIAATLNRLGYRTRGGQTWRVHSVQNTRHYYHLANHRNDDTWLTIEQAAARLGVSHTVVKRLIRQETLPATQVVASTPWIINRQDLDLPAVQSEVEAVRAGRQLRRNRLGPGRRRARPGRRRRSQAPSSHPPPAHTSDAPGAPMRAAPTAPRTPPSPWSRPIRARRTRARIGRWPRTVRSRRAFLPRRTRPPAFRAGGADIELRDRSPPALRGWDRRRQPRRPVPAPACGVPDPGTRSVATGRRRSNGLRHASRSRAAIRRSDRDRGHRRSRPSGP